MKYEKIESGMTLYDRHKRTMGNTAIKSIGEWEVRILAVYPERRTALVSWNGNKAEVWHARRLSALKDWSMYDKRVATYEKNMLGAVTRCRKLTKSEREKLRGGA